MNRRVDASLVASVGPGGTFPQVRLPEVAFAGRSNVGKSSLINRLVGRRHFAPISSAPGKTKTIRFYTVDESLALVDLPGYGYAKVARSLRKAWKTLVEAYFAGSPSLVGIVHVIDIRHPGLKNDFLLSDWLSTVNVDSLIVATKADKVPRAHRPRLAGEIRDALGGPDSTVVVFSAVTGEGKDDVWRWLWSRIGVRQVTRRGSDPLSEARAG